MTEPADDSDHARRWTELRERCALVDDEHLLVLDKPAGISVTGERHDVDLVSLATAAGEWIRPAHRIDKVTSGVVLLARTPDTHAHLTRQFNRRTVDKYYVAITRSTGLPPRGEIDLPLSEGRKKRVRVAAPRQAIRSTDTPSAHRWSVAEQDLITGKRTYPSVTRFVRLWEGAGHSLLLVRPISGRRHQIRVHLAWIGHPLAGDPLFPHEHDPGRTLLHSWRLGFERPEGRRQLVEAPPGPDFWEPVGPVPVEELLTEATSVAGASDDTAS